MDFRIKRFVELSKGLKASNDTYIHDETLRIILDKCAELSPLITSHYSTMNQFVQAQILYDVLVNICIMKDLDVERIISKNK